MKVNIRLVVGLGLIFVVQGVMAQSAKNENPNEQLAYLIGQWKLRIESMDITAHMNFEWGPDRTYIFSTNKNIRDGKESHENSAMIAWDGVEGKFVISSVYHGAGSLLVGRGTVQIENGLISRDIRLHYAPDQHVPFMKLKAPRDGQILDYRQRWKIVDENSFTGYIEAFMDGEWRNPFDNNDPEAELWKRVK